MEPMISVFVSYAHADKPVARALVRALTSYGLRVWIDEGELLVGDSIIERISKALDEVHFVVAIVSVHSVGSSWCQKELSLAMTGGIKQRGVKVLPLRLGDVEMPPSLRDVLYLQVDEGMLDVAAKELVLAAMRHETEHRLAQGMVATNQPSIRRNDNGVSSTSTLNASLTSRKAEVHDALTDYLSTPSKPGPGRVRGTVKWFNSEKGFGFIKPDGGGADIFVHYSELEINGFRTLDENQRVEFSILQAAQGPQAGKVRVI
jgi:cold shock CspA family protein